LSVSYGLCGRVRDRRRCCAEAHKLHDADDARISHSESQDDECHVIVRRRAGGKGVGRTKQALEQLLGIQVRVGLRLGDHSVFAPKSPAPLST